jgi:penicillin amidase
VVTEFLQGTIKPGEYALHRVPQTLNETDTFEAAIAMMRSESVEEFDTALGKWSYPPVNVIFGDSNGDIGYHMTGASPIRANNPNVSGNTYQDGSGSAGEWQGLIPHDFQPHVFNPEQGWLASANHRPVESWYPMQQSGSGSSGHTTRSWRLYELIQAYTHALTPTDVLAIHYDDVDPARRTMVKAAVYLVDIQRANLTAEATRALDLLRPWLARGAHCSTSDPVYPLVYNISTSFRMSTSRLTSLARYGGGESGLVLFCKALREVIETNGIIDSDSRAYIENAIVQSWNACLTKYGDNPSLWLERFRNFQAARNLEYMVGLDGFPSLNSELGIDYPILSDLTTSTIFSQGSQSYTQFVSLDDVDSAMSLMPVGNSEVPRNPFYKVNLNAWSKGALHPAPLSRKAVAAFQVDTEMISRTK